MVSKISCILTSCMASHRSAGVFIFSIFTHRKISFKRRGKNSQLRMAFLRWVAVCCGLATSLAFIYGTLSADLAVEVWKNPKLQRCLRRSSEFFQWKTGALVEVESVGPFLWSTCNLENRDWYVGKRSFNGFWIGERTSPMTGNMIFLSNFFRQ